MTRASGIGALAVALLASTAHAQSPNYYTNHAGTGPAGLGDPVKLSEAVGNGTRKQDYLGDSSGQHVTPTRGSTAQTLANILGRTFNILDYGAAMNCAGGVDDTAAWSSAFAAAGAAGGGQVDVPTGCSIVDAVTLASDNVHLHGQGQGASLVRAKTTSSTPLTVNASHVIIDGLSFTSGSLQVAGNYINLVAGEDVAIEHFDMIGGYIPLLIQNGDSQYIGQGRFYSTTGPATVKVTGGNDQYLYHLVSDNNPAAQPGSGVWVTNNGGIWMDALDFIHSGDVYKFATVNPSDAITWAFVSNSAADTSSGCGILVSPATGTSIRGLNFVGDWTSTNQNGVCTSGTGAIDGLNFSAHRSLNNLQRGFFIAAGVNLSIDASVISGNSTSNPGFYAGVEIGPGVSYWSIRNNKIGAALGFGNNHYNNISVDAGAGDKFSIQNNDLIGAVNAPLMDNSTGGTKKISGNLPIAAPQTIALTGSPFNYTVKQHGTFYITSGTVNAVSFIHQAVTVGLNANSSAVTLEAGDQLSVNYSVVPTITFVGD